MNKKSMVTLAVTFLVLSMASVSMAGPMGGGMGMGGGAKARAVAWNAKSAGTSASAAHRTTARRWKAWQAKNLELRKEYIGNLVKSGAMTQEQADARIKSMEAAQAFRAKNNLVAPGAMQGVKLTDEQKVEMKKLFEQRLAIRKDALASYVASGQITQIQADNQIKRMQDNFNYKLENGFGSQKGGRGMGGGKGMGRGGMGGGPRF